MVSGTITAAAPWRGSDVIVWFLADKRKQRKGESKRRRKGGREGRSQGWRRLRGGFVGGMVEGGDGAAMSGVTRLA